MEFEAVVNGLEMVAEFGAKALRVLQNDPMLVIKQITQAWETKDQNIAQYCSIAQELTRCCKSISFDYKPREDNTNADALARLTSTRRMRIKALCRRRPRLP